MRCVKQIPHLEPNMLNTPKHQDPLVVFAGSELFLFHCFDVFHFEFLCSFHLHLPALATQKIVGAVYRTLAVSHNAAQRSKRNQKL